MIKTKIKSFRANTKIMEKSRKEKAIQISGVEELSKVAEVGKIYEWQDEYGRFFKVKVTDISVDIKKGGIYVELTEIWQ